MDKDYLEDLFSVFGNVMIKRMFGGQGIFRDGVMFALVADEILYLKADDELAKDYKQAGSVPFTYEGKKKPITMSYYTLPDEAMDDPDAIAIWARQSFAVAWKNKK